MNTIINDLIKNEGEGLLNVVGAIFCGLSAVVIIVAVVAWLIQNWMFPVLLAAALLIYFIAFVITDKITDKITKIWEN